jgi:hypothetical protein
MRWPLMLLALAGCDLVIGLDYRDPGPAPGNEDGDRKVDDDDNCPGTANSDQADMDDGGVGDVCDPAPATPGDRIAVFYGFDVEDPAFEVRSGSWFVTGGQLVFASTDMPDKSYFTRNAPALRPPYTVEAHFTLDHIGVFAAFGISGNLNDVANGASCTLVRNTSGPDQVRAWWNGGSDSAVATIVDGESYRAILEVRDDEIACAMKGDTAGQGGSIRRDMDEVRDGYVGFDAFNEVGARVDYLVVYAKN